MRTPRIKLSGRISVFHCISRICGGERLLDDLSKETLTAMLWKLAGFCGMEVITYCMMANHFHVLIRVPEPPQLTDGQLVERLERFLGLGGVGVLDKEELRLRGLGLGQAAQLALLRRQGLRLGDVAGAAAHVGAPERQDQQYGRGQSAKEAHFDLIIAIP